MRTLSPESGAGLDSAIGMRDLLPPESRARRNISNQIQGVFESYGYELVTTPLVEKVETFERGPLFDRRDLLRFVEPDSGEVIALRTDMTPQVARVVCTRLSAYPPPFRIRYEGTVIRRRRGRARRQRQIAQVGVELIGMAAPHADAEVVQLCAEACHAVGLADFRIELAEVGVARALLKAENPHLVESVQEAFARKDEALLMTQLKAAGVGADERRRLTSLLHLHGSLDVLAEAEKALKGTAAEPHLRALREVTRRLEGAGLAQRLGVDLGEIRGEAYYTGVSFALFARGPGEAVASGGRYDDLLGRYGAAAPATGAAIDIENLLRALDAAERPWRASGPARALVTGDFENASDYANALRKAGLAAAVLPDASQETAMRYARAWSRAVVIVVAAGEAKAIRVRDGATQAVHRQLSSAEAGSLQAWVRAEQEE